MRGKRAKIRDIKPDPKYGNVLLGRFINYVMVKGKKTVAQNIVYGAFEVIKEKTKQDPRHIFNKALKKLLNSLLSAFIIFIIVPLTPFHDNEFLTS